MPRTRTTKKLAQRIDLNYFKRPTPLKRAKLWLCLVLPLLSLVWILWRGFSGDYRVYSSGRLSQAHAVLEKECAACHVQRAGSFSAKVLDSACLDCHDGPAHHASQVLAPDCATCHPEHRGHINIAAASNQACAECHANLQAGSRPLHVVAHIRSFNNDHSEFAARRPVGNAPASDPGTIRLNHAIHLKPIRHGPSGPLVNLECGNCHRPIAADADLTYADPKYRAATVSYKDSDEFLPMSLESLRPLKPVSGRERMSPVRFANACAGCHSLAFDKRFDEGVPHDKPEVVHAFLIKKFQQYITSHPGDLRVTRDPGRDLSGRPLSPQVRVLTPAQWVAERIAEAEELLWRKTCKQCHELEPFSKTSQPPTAEAMQRGEAEQFSPKLGKLPYVAPANIRLEWMPHAKFDHDAHRGFTCVSCHARALTSTEASDVLLPGIATCRTCHAPGPDRAESRCSECHTYHDWSKRREVTPKFTLPALRTVGQ